jgi:SulP family sulfate permease
MIVPQLARLTPALISSLRTYSRADITSDIAAGITVGLVALPLAMAFGIASGVTPQAGLYTAIVGGLICALLGGSRVQVSGPTGAFVVIVAGIIHDHGLSGLLMVTMMAGVLLVILGLTGLGNAVKFIPRPVVVGFTNGIALLIVSTQIKDFLGLQMPSPSEFFERMEAIAAALPTTHLPALALGLLTLTIVLGLPRVLPRVPGSIAALVVATLIAQVLGLEVATIGSTFGAIPSSLPTFDVPQFRSDLIVPLAQPAFTVAILSALESLLSAVVADGMAGSHHNSNAELVAQGAANIVVPMVGGIPVTGAIARTATNVRAGARTPVSAIVHALTLLVVVLVAAPLASGIPLAVLAAILFVVAWNMGEWREIPGILRLEAADIAVWLITFALTVMADLTIAVEAGLALAALLYIYRVTETTSVSIATPEYIAAGHVHSLQGRDVPPYVSIIRIHGPFLFGMTDKLRDVTREVDALAPIVVLRLRNMTAIDATGLHALEQFAERLRASNRTLLMCGARHQPARFLSKAEFVDEIGRENILPHVEAALARAREVYEKADGVRRAEL